MKKSVITLFSALLVSSAVAVNSNTVNAAKTQDDNESTASITINPGDLSIIKPAADINFEAITWNGQNQTRTGADNSILVGDYRGSVSKGWSLKVQKLRKNDGFENGIDLAFTASTQSKNISSQTNKTNVSYDSFNIAWADKNNIKDTELDSLINLKPYLEVEKNVRIGDNDSSKEYKTTLVWTLSTTPEN